MTRGDRTSPLVRLHAVSKVYRLYDSPWQRLLTWGSLGRLRPYREFRALDDVSLEVARGETIGVLGRNGAGKTTLLRLISGVLAPSGGQVLRQGRVVSLLELGTGFDPELSGHANIERSAQLLRLDEVLLRRRAEIAEFTELGDFLDRPVKTYSLGMYVRLAFSLFAFSEADLFVIDEALGVGDIFFQQKCTDQIRAMAESGTSVLFSSHDWSAVQALCTRAILLDRGRLLMDEHPTEVTQAYRTGLHETEGPRFDVRQGSGSTTFGDGAVEFLEAGVADAAGRPADAFAAGDTAVIAVRFRACVDLDDPNIGLQIQSRFGQVVWCTTTCWNNLALGRYPAGRAFQVRFRVRLNLGRGTYTLTTAVAENRRQPRQIYIWVKGFSAIQVTGPADESYAGDAALPYSVEAPDGRSAEGGPRTGVGVSPLFAP
ncbi:MAG: ABC transporter ATP-binding protein [Planctomycetes bacterium]|nr:ABC transporter ATP-binding protein [Planctomycetota bacterium]